MKHESFPLLLRLDCRDIAGNLELKYTEKSEIMQGQASTHRITHKILSLKTERVKRVHENPTGHVLIIVNLNIRLTRQHHRE